MKERAIVNVITKLGAHVRWFLNGTKHIDKWTMAKARFLGFSAVEPTEMEYFCAMKHAMGNRVNCLIRFAQCTYCRDYQQGYLPPQYALPAVPMKVGYMPTGGGEMEGVSYIYISTGSTRVVTFWKEGETVTEWIGKDANGMIRMFREHRTNGESDAYRDIR